MKQLKADLHIHTAEDPEDLIFYTAEELIDRAHELGYSVLAITNHNRVTYTEYLRDYAAERGIVLIPGMEASIRRRHVLLYNLAFENISRSDIKSLAKVRNRSSLVIAPHPFYPSHLALGNTLIRHIRLFDAIEHCHFYSRAIDFNKKAIRVARQYGLPMVGTSDAHQRLQFHTTYSLIEAEHHPDAVIQAIKEGRVEVVTRPLPLQVLLKINLKMSWRNTRIKLHPSGRKGNGNY